MTWFKVDDSFYDHPKVFDAPDCAVALWTRAGTWSARNLTDGFVPTGMPARLCDDHETAVKELVRRGLWSRTSGGYRFHDWGQYQPTRSEAIAGRNKMASGGALGNHRRWHTGKGRTDPDCRYCQGAPIGSSGSDEPDATRSNPDPSVTSALPNSGSGSTPTRPSGRPVDNHENRDQQPAGQHKQLRVPDRPPDQVPEDIPESPPNPPDPARPGPKGGSSLTSTTDRANTGPEPPTRCPQHLDNPDPPPCGPCADTRRAHQRWEVAAAERRRNAPHCPTHRGQPAHNCAGCRADQLAAPDPED